MQRNACYWRDRFLPLAVFVGVLFAPQLAQLSFADFVRSFDSTIRLAKDSTLDITETIVVDFESPRHGINRFIPVRYERYNGRYSIELRVDSVTDENGSAIKFVEQHQGRDVNLHIGSADATMTGDHTYKLHYIVRRAINFFGTGPELYWNVTGDEWPYPIRAASATVILPDGIDMSKVKTDCYVGPPGSTQKGVVDLTKSPPVFSTKEILNAGEGMTIAVGMPPGSVTRPSLIQEIWWFARDWWPLVLLPALAGSFAFYRWTTAGRDEDAGRQAVGVEWEPPKDLTPAEVGTLIDESCDTPDVIATLIDLAARGYLTIREVKTEKLHFLSTTDYEFHKVTPPPANDQLLDYEALFFGGIFPGGSDTSMLSSLKEKFYPNIEPMKKAIYDSLTTRALFKANPDAVRGKWIGAGVVLCIIGGAWLWGFGASMLAFPLGFAFAGIIFIAVAKAMPAKTAAGTRKLLECQSFKRFVSLVEKDRIRTMAKTDPTIFGRLLPYAMVLGVADQWAEAFKDLMVAAPDWYHSNSNDAFNTYWFVHSLGGGMRTMQQTLTSRPQSTSSAGSGHSAFSGGGGFSGGGFGGGGGGSW